MNLQEQEKQKCLGLNQLKHYLFVRKSRQRCGGNSGPEDFSRGGSDTGKYSAGTGGIHHTGTGGFSDSRKGRAFGTEAE